MARSALFHRVSAPFRQYFRDRALPAAAKRERARDRLGIAADVPDVPAIIDGALGWLCAAQDHSSSQDGGVARDYSLVNEWASSYPETTGYIIPTFLQSARDDDPRDLRGRARRMLDWLVAIQLHNGAFQGGKIDSRPIVPVTFNTGQILLGLAAGEATFGSYGRPLRSAADWLVATQDADGCWRSHPTPFAASGEKTYETHVAWGLLEAERVCPNRGYAEAALKNIRWAVGKQHENGWLDDCCLTDATKPLSHTLGYALRGLIEGYRFSSDSELATAAKRTADGLLSVLGENGFLPGRLTSTWSPAADWACLTGNAQIAHCWLQLFEDSGDAKYLNAGRLAGSYVCRTVRLEGPPGVEGGVKGSFPVDGDYGRFEYPSWAAKFLIDTLLLQQRIALAQHGRS